MNDIKKQIISFRNENLDNDNGSFSLITKNATQFPHLYSKDQRFELVDIVIGFDFGSSCTKIVLQAPYIGGRWAHIIPFIKYGYPGNKNLLPTKIYCNSNGVFSLTETDETICFDRLKTELIKNSDSPIVEKEIHLHSDLTPKILVIAYMAIALQEIRQWFLSMQSNIFSNNKIRWHLNIGIPSAGYNDLNLKKLFKEVAQIAWLLSTMLGKINIKKIQKIIDPDITGGIHFNCDINAEDINVIPEVAAEVVGYARSPLRDEGLHVLIDIGARTLDIASFMLHKKDGEDKYSILTADLDELGATIFNYNRFKALANELIQLAKKHNEDLITPIPTSITSYLQKFNTNERELIQEFYYKCKSLIAKTIRDLKQNRDPNSDRWKTGLPIFLCGGGKDIALYRQALNEHNIWLQQYTNIKELLIKEIPMPENLRAENLNRKDYHRFAVAYGLSFPSYDIGEIKPPQEIEHIQRSEQKDHSDRFVPKEYV